MSDQKRNILVIVLICLLPVIAFAAGFFTNEYIHTRSAIQSTPTLNIGGGDGDLDLFWEAWSHIDRDFIGETPSQQQLNYAAIRGVLSSLDDPYTVFLEPVVRDEEEIQLRGNFGGIGAYIQRNDVGEVVLVVIPGNPAEQAGIRDGDVLLAIDDLTVTPELTTEEIVQVVRGEVGTDVTLTVRHMDEDEPVEIVVTRGTILVPSIIARIMPDNPTIGYIQLSRFSGESPAEMLDAVAELEAEGATALILDLRGNGGGLLDASIDIADQFISEGDLLFSQSKREGEQTYTASESATAAPEIPMVVLVDGGTASASEILAGALQDNERATIMGLTTFGKGSVQLVYDLSDGSSVHVTSARWFTPDRNQIDQQGLVPNIVVEPSAEAVESGRDEILEKAIEFLETK